MRSKSVITLVSCIFASLLFTNPAHALGRKRDKSSQDIRQAYPVRIAKLGDLYPSDFVLPDGKTQASIVDSLSVMMRTELASGDSKIQIEAEGSSTSRYEIRGGVTAFEGDIQKYGVKFGFSPGKIISVGKLVGGEGEVNVDIGRLDMDFHIIDTQANPPVVVVAASASVLDIKGSLTAKVDFGNITSEADFFKQTSVSNAFRKVIAKAFEKIMTNPKTNFLLDWAAPVAYISYENHSLFFSFGRRQGIENGNWFTVYDSNGYRIAEIEVDYADLDYSSAKVINDPDGSILERIERGNLLKIFYPQSSFLY